MKVKTSELSGAALDWAVAIAGGLEFDEKGCAIWYGDDPPYYEAARRPFIPSTNWAQGGPIIERERIQVGPLYLGSGEKEWFAHNHSTMRWDEAGEFINGSDGQSHGPTPLIAAMRCYVASKLGDEVEVPEELA
jgi:hypothetical protein